jgi:hypothetical protein
MRGALERGVDAPVVRLTEVVDEGRETEQSGGWPLYYFASDGTPGDAKGQGVSDNWWVIRPDGTPVRSGAAETATPTPTSTETPTPTPTPSDDDDGGGNGY